VRKVEIVKRKKVTITIEMVCNPDEYETVGNKIKWLKTGLRQYITQDYSCYKKVKISSKINKIKKDRDNLPEKKL